MVHKWIYDHSRSRSTDSGQLSEDRATFDRQNNNVGYELPCKSTTIGWHIKCE
jgi:hypothetical protein